MGGGSCRREVTGLRSLRRFARRPPGVTRELGRQLALKPVAMDSLPAVQIVAFQ